MILFLVSIVAVILFLHLASFIPFLIASIFAGIAWGAIFTGFMRSHLK
ncbi:hypothetical protein MTZ49_08925 [Entomomonas sp. E2T0]|nr:hypothetical protein [Entomomonas sp. E2T0]UYZ82738.1 hypothetical protein MTZ49_08925 [Entomomonas sp. E2T0]